jgi:hypothetical protein
VDVELGAMDRDGEESRERGIAGGCVGAGRTRWIPVGNPLPTRSIFQSGSSQQHSAASSAP